MSLTIQADQAFFGIGIPLIQANHLLVKHLSENPRTRELEAHALRLSSEDYPWQKIRDFVVAVCAWGGYAGIAGRVLKNNSEDDIAAAFRDSWRILETDHTGQARALARLNRLHGLGTPSFASKHLRFFRPDLCPVFDSVLQAALPYRFDCEGYANFAHDCHALAEHLNNSGLAGSTDRLHGKWYASDVEAVIYILVKDPRGAA